MWGHRLWQDLLGAKLRDPKGTLIISDWISAVVIASVFFVPLDVYYYGIFSFFIAFVSSFRSPTFEKYLVATVDGDDLMQANSSFQMINEFVKIIGPALAVSVLAILPASLKSLGFVIDSASYVIAALLLIGLIEIQRNENDAKEDKQRSWLSKWREGLSPLKDPVILTASFGANFVKKWSLAVQLGASSLLLGVCYSLIGLGNSLFTMMLAAFLTGVFNAIYNMSASTFWQKSVPYSQLGRFFGFANSVFAFITLVGMSANAYISSRFTAGFDIMLCGMLIALAGMILIVTISIVKSKEALKEKEAV